MNRFAIAVACCAWLSLVCPHRVAAFQPALNYTGLSFQVSTKPLLAAGEDILVTLSLINATDAAITVLPLDYAQLEFSLDFRYEDGRSSTMSGGTSGELASSQYGSLIATIVVPRRTVQVPAHGHISRTMTLAELGINPWAGTFRLTARYDNTLTARTAFRISFQPARDVPKLIGLLEASDLGARQFASGYLRQVTWDLGPGHRPLWRDRVPGWRSTRFRASGSVVSTSLTRR